MHSVGEFCAILLLLLVGGFLLLEEGRKVSVPILRTLLIALSHHGALRRFCENSSLAIRFSRRFVAGITMEEALKVATELNRQGIAVTLDALGEDVRSAREAREAAATYHALLDAIAERKLEAHISIKLSQMGLELSPPLTETIVASLAGHAARIGSFVRVDMEGSALTQQTLDLVWRIHSLPDLSGAIGVVLQSYLYRTAADIDLMLAEGIRVRLCKGAYHEPEAVAYTSKREVDEHFYQQSIRLLNSEQHHGIATHDEALIARILTYVREHKIPPSHFEFQMLYGIRRDLQQALTGQGYSVRVYVPFGATWYPYFIRRLAERPANLVFLLKNLLHP